MNTIASLRRVMILIVALGTVFVDTSCTRAQRARHALATADQEFTAGRYDRAEIEYKNALQLSPLNPRAIARLGTIYRIDGRTAPALSFLAKAKELQPNDTDVRVNLAYAYVAAGAVSLARQEALFVIQHQPDDPDAPLLIAETSKTPAEQEAARKLLENVRPKNRSAALVALGQLALRSGQPAAGQRLFEQALAADTKSANAAAALGMLAWARRDFANADKWLEQAAALSPVRSPHRVRYAEYKVQTGDRQAGSRLLADVTKQAPDFLPAWRVRIQLAASEKKYDEALAMSREALQRDSTDIELLLLDAQVRLAKGDLDPAITELERVVALYPRLPGGWYLLGSAYLRKGNADKASEAMARAVALVPDYTPAVVALADLNVRRGSYTAAVTALKPLAAKHPEDVRLQLLLAQAYGGLDDLDSALAVYTTAERVAPGDAQIPYFRGLILQRQGKLDAARSAFEQTLRLNPAAVQPVLRLAEMDAAGKAYDRARQRAELALVRAPKAMELYLLLANLAMAQSNIDDAKIALERAITQQPSAPAPYLALARVYVANHEEDKAFAQLRKLIAAEPNNVQALTTMAVLYEATGKQPQARETYEKVLALQPKSPVALNNLACLLSDRPGEIAKAYELAQQARALLPDDPRTADTLGWVLYRKGDYPQALAILRDSAPKLPETAEAQYHLGMACYMIGDTAGAKAALEAALKTDAHFDHAGVAREKLAVLAMSSVALTPADRVRLDGIASAPAADPIALTDLSVVYQHQGNLAKAREMAQQAVAASPKSPPALIQLARVLAAQGDRPRALEQAREAHTLAPDNGEVTHVLGRIALDDRQFRWAASLLEEAAREQPMAPDVLRDWAQAAYSVGRVSDAEHAANRAHDLARGSGDDANVSEFLKLLAIASNPTAETDASGFVEEVLKRDPTNLPALVARANLAERQHNLKSARTMYEQALDHYPDFGPAQKALATLYAVDPKLPPNAITVATRARATYPTDPAVAKALGILCYKAGDYRRSASLLQESAAAIPHDGSLLFYLGMSQYQLKRTAEAKRTLQGALDAGLEKDLANDARKVTSGPN